MRIARILIAAAIAAIAALALTAGNAAATNGVEVTDEATATHCPAIVGAGAEAAGGCPIFAHGEVELSGHFIGIESHDLTCNVEFEGIVDEDGAGLVQHANYTDHMAGACTRDPCEEAGHEMEAYPLQGEETGSGLVLEAELCFVNKQDHSGETRCQFEMPVEEPTPHDYEVDLNDERGVSHEGFRCEFDGEIHIEPDAQHPAIEVNHL